MKEARQITARAPERIRRATQPGVLARASTAAYAYAQPATRALFYGLLFALALYVALGASAGVAFAQDGGAIEQSIQNAQDWLAGIMTTLGGLGLIASVGVKAVARTNENMHHASHLGMTGSGIAILAGLLLPDILDLIESFAA